MSKSSRTSISTQEDRPRKSITADQLSNTLPARPSVAGRPDSGRNSESGETLQLRSQLRDLMQKQSESQVEVRAVTLENSHLKNKVAEQQQIIFDLQQANMVVENRIKQYVEIQNSMQGATAAGQQAQQQVVRLKAQMESAAVQLRDALASKDVLLRQISDLQLQLRESQAHQEATLLELQQNYQRQLQQQTSEAGQRLMAQKAENDALQGELTKAKQLYESSQREITHLKQQTEQQIAQLKQEQTAQTATQLRQHQQEVASLQERLKALQENSAQKQARQISDSDASLEQYVQRENALRAEVEKLQGDLTDMQGQIEKTRSEVESLRQQNARYKEKLQKAVVSLQQNKQTQEGFQAELQAAKDSYLAQLDQQKQAAQRRLKLREEQLRLEAQDALQRQEQLHEETKANYDRAQCVLQQQAVELQSTRDVIQDLKRELQQTRKEAHELRLKLHAAERGSIQKEKILRELQTGLQAAKDQLGLQEQSGGAVVAQFQVLSEEMNRKMALLQETADKKLLTHSQLLVKNVQELAAQNTALEKERAKAMQQVDALEAKLLVSGREKAALSASVEEKAAQISILNQQLAQHTARLSQQQLLTEAAKLEAEQLLDQKVELEQQLINTTTKSGEQKTSIQPVNQHELTTQFLTITTQYKEHVSGLKEKLELEEKKSLQLAEETRLLQAQKQQLSQRIKALEEDLALQQKTAERLKETLQDTQLNDTQQKDLELQLNEAHLALASPDPRVRVLESQVNQLHEKLSQKEREITDLKALLNSSKEEAETLKKSLALKEAECQSMAENARESLSSRTALQQQIEQKHAVLTQLQQTIQKDAPEVARLQAQNEAYLADISRLEDTMAVLKQRYKELYNKAVQIRDNNGSLERALTEIQEVKRSQEDEIRELQFKLRQTQFLQQQNEDLQAELETLRDRHGKLLEDLKRLSADLSSTQREKQEQGFLIIDLRERLDQYDLKLQQETDRFRAETLDLQQQLQVKTATLAQTQEELHRNLLETQRLQQETSSVRERLENNPHLRELSAENASLKQQLHQLTQSLSGLEVNLAQNQRVLAHQKEETQRLQHYAKVLQTADFKLVYTQAEIQGESTALQLARQWALSPEELSILVKNKFVRAKDLKEFTLKEMETQRERLQSTVRQTIFRAPVSARSDLQKILVYLDALRLGMLRARCRYAEFPAVQQIAECVLSNPSIAAQVTERQFSQKLDRADVSGDLVRISGQLTAQNFIYNPVVSDYLFGLCFARAVYQREFSGPGSEALWRRLFGAVFQLTALWGLSQPVLDRTGVLVDSALYPGEDLAQQINIPVQLGLLAIQLGTLGAKLTWDDARIEGTAFPGVSISKWNGEEWTDEVLLQPRFVE